MLIIAYFAVFCHYEDFQQMCFFSPQASVPASAAKPMPWGFLLSFPSDQHGHQRRCPFTSVGRKSPHCGDLRGLFGVPAPKFNQQALFAVGFAPVSRISQRGGFRVRGMKKRAFEALMIPSFSISPQTGSNFALSLQPRQLPVQPPKSRHRGGQGGTKGCLCFLPCCRFIIAGMFSYCIFIFGQGRASRKQIPSRSQIIFGR